MGVSGNEDNTVDLFLECRVPIRDETITSSGTFVVEVCASVFELTA